MFLGRCQAGAASDGCNDQCRRRNRPLRGPRISDSLGFESRPTLPHIIAELGLHAELADDSSVRGTAPVLDDACQPGTRWLRTSVLATWADMVTGMSASHSILPRIPVTLDLETQLIRPVEAGTELLVESRPVKSGRTVAVSDARFMDRATGELVAISYATFVASANPDHVMGGGFPSVLPAETLLDVPLTERVQLRAIAPGVMELPRLPDGQNMTGAIQGGLLAVAAEEAAASLMAEPALLVMLNVRYFRPFEVGPARAIARKDGNLCTIEIVDVGTGKVGAMATARWVPVDGCELNS